MSNAESGEAQATAQVGVQSTLGRVAWLLRCTGTPPVRLFGIGALALLAGLAEAGCLVSIVSLSADAVGGQGTQLGPVSMDTWSPGSTAAVGGALVATALLANVGGSHLLARVSTRAVKVLRDRLVVAHMGTRVEAQDRLPEGKMAELAGLGAYQADAALGAVGGCISASALLVAYMSVAIITQPAAAVAASIAGAVLLAAVRPITGQARRAMRGYIDRSADLLEWCAQTVALRRELRVFGVERPAIEKARQLNAVATLAGQRARFLSGASPAIYQATALGAVLIAVIVARNADVVKPAALAAVAVLLVRALSLLQRLSLAIQGLATTTPHVEDVVATIEEFEDQARRIGSVCLDPIATLEVRDVEFSYDPSVPVLLGVNITVAAGESVAIAGPSGSGKSTLLQLILGVREPTAGSILLNGIDVREVDEVALRREVALVPQDNQLLLGTIEENVAFLRPMPQSVVLEALKSAALPAGDTSAEGKLGAGAAQLSGGQRQRVGLARALAGAPSLVLLDEPTSALDHGTERIVNDTLDQLRGKATIVVIAHRPSTVAACERVIVLTGGEVVADGPTAELMDTDPYLVEMFEHPGTSRRQLGEST